MAGTLASVISATSLSVIFCKRGKSNWRPPNGRSSKVIAIRAGVVCPYVSADAVHKAMARARASGMERRENTKDTVH